MVVPIFSLDDDPRPGWPVEVSTPENIVAVQKAIEEDRRMIYTQLEELPNIHVLTHRIVNEHLQVCNLCVPHCLSEEQQQCRANSCRQTLKIFRSGMSKEVNSIITGDETWIYYYDVPTESQRKILVFKKEEHPTQARKSISV